MESSAHPHRPYYVAPDEMLSASGAGGASERFEHSDVDVGGLVQSWAANMALGFGSTALIMPFEVAKTLLQVQYIPREDLMPATATASPHVDYDLSDEDDVDVYFQESTRHGATLRPPALVDEVRRKDSKGYLLRESVFDESTRPDFTLPVIVRGGVFEMMKTIAKWKHETVTALWKSQITTFVLESMSSAIQPMLYSILSGIFLANSPLSALPLEHIPRPAYPLLVATSSHLITGVLLSPLDLVRTRLIVQSSQSQHRTYTGPIDALKAIFRTEGGIKTTYLHSNLLLPTMLDYSIRPFFHLATPLFIDRFLGISVSYSPVTYAILEFLLSTSALLVTLPIETIRRRLQIQSRAPRGLQATSAKDGKTFPRHFRACVETRPTEYSGISEAFYRILTEETGRTKVKPPLTRRASHGANAKRAGMEDSQELGRKEGPLAGWKQLFKGFSMGAGANAVVLVLSIVAGRDALGGNTWAEM